MTIENDWNVRVFVEALLEPETYCHVVDQPADLVDAPGIDLSTDIG